MGKHQCNNRHTNTSMLQINSKTTKKWKEQLTDQDCQAMGDAHLPSPMCKTIGANEDWTARRIHIYVE